MTELEEAVWRRLRQIPSGMVCTYGDLAIAVGLPRGARAVGRVLSHNPEPVVTPCHRVVCSNGRLGGYMGGFDQTPRKKDLLAKEGVDVEDGLVVDFNAIRFVFPMDRSNP